MNRNEQKIMEILLKETTSKEGIENINYLMGLHNLTSEDIEVEK